MESQQNKENRKKLFGLIHQLYNKNQDFLDNDTKEQLITAASAIENGKELGLIAIGLYPYLLSEMTNEKKDKPSELNDLMLFVLFLKGKYSRFRMI